LQQLAPEGRQQLLKSDLYQIFCSDKYYTQELRRFGFEHAEYLALATDPSTFCAHLNKPVPKRFECDVCFVGSIDSSPELLTLRRQQRWEHFPILNTAIDEIMVHANKPSPDMVIKELQRVREHLPWDISAVFCRTVYEEANTYIRRGTVNAINKHPVKVFGPDKWNGMKPNITHGGKIDYVKGLPLLYASSKIVLNITSPQMRNAATSRLFDVPASGGFVLSDYRPVMHELFGDAIDTYADMRELRAKIDYYLAHLKERKERSLRMREIVLAKHTWEHRANDLLQCMASRHAYS
jgi:spore maturation protein CgeB